MNHEGLKNKQHTCLITFTGEPSAAMFIAPSVTPWKSRYEGATPRNPAIRRFYYDRPNNYRIHDYQQYYLNLEQENARNDTAEWKRLYTFNQVYGTFHLEAREVHKAKESFKQYASERFHNYYDYNSVAWRDPYVPCSCSCKGGHICAIENVDQEDFDQCIKDTVCGVSGLCPSVPSIVLTVLYTVIKVYT